MPDPARWIVGCDWFLGLRDVGRPDGKTIAPL